jgi:hypothetical protein
MGSIIDEYNSALDRGLTIKDTTLVLLIRKNRQPKYIPIKISLTNC